MRTRRISRSSTAENIAATVLDVLRAGGYTHVLAPATGFGKNVLPRIAAKLDVAQVSDVIGDRIARHIRAADLRRQRVRNRAIEGSDQGPHGAHDGIRCCAGDGGNAADRRRRSAAPDTGPSKVIGQELTKSERPELAGARIVISGGRGMGSGENFKMLEALADKLNAAIGASRAAVDAGYVPNDYQVGQTGKIVAPDFTSPSASRARSSIWRA